MTNTIMFFSVKTIKIVLIINVLYFKNTFIDKSNYYKFYIIRSIYFFIPNLKINLSYLKFKFC